MKNTVYLKTDPADPAGESVAEAGRMIRAGGLVAFPTETVYGLGANAFDPAAVAAVFRAKGRPSDNPLIVHIADPGQVDDLTDDVTVPARRVMEAFWPGPLTVVLPRNPRVPDEVTAGLDTVAVRMPNHPVALALIRAAGVPVAAPSANSSGKPSPTTAQHVLADLKGRIDAVLDGGPCSVGVESTVLDMTSDPPVILRPGGVTREDLESVIGHVAFEPALHRGDGRAVPKSPGMKYTHYAPEAEVVVVAGDDYAQVFNTAAELVARERAAGKRVGVLASAETARGYCAEAVFPVGFRARLETVAQNLFYGLRSLDEENIDIIVAEGYPETGIGAAIMDRLRKAAGNNVIYTGGEANNSDR